MDKATLGKTFALVDPVTNRLFVGFGSTLDVAVVDWLHQVNAARAAEFRIVAQIREYVGGVK
jgi:hypothetical protein